MGLFEQYLLTEAGLSPADKKAIDVLNKQIATIDTQILAKVGPVGKGQFMNQSGENAGHINDQDPVYKALTARRAMLVARKLKISGKENAIKI
jgi:hypothetical protein